MERGGVLGGGCLPQQQEKVLIQSGYLEGVELRRWWAKVQRMAREGTEYLGEPPEVRLPKVGHLNPNIELESNFNIELKSNPNIELKSEPISKFNPYIELKSNIKIELKSNPKI